MELPSCSQTRYGIATTEAVAPAQHRQRQQRQHATATATADSDGNAYCYCGAEVYADAPAARHATSTPISSSLVG